MTFLRNRNSVILVSIISVICLPSWPVSAIRCYTCSYVDTEADNTCIQDPKGTKRITSCTKKYCTIMRQEAVRPVGKVMSFIRDCQDKPLYLNAVKTDETFKTFYRACTTDLCNDSDGRHVATNVDPNFGAAQNMVIKGGGGSSGGGSSHVSSGAHLGGILCASAILQFFVNRL